MYIHAHREIFYVGLSRKFARILGSRDEGEQRVWEFLTICSPLTWKLYSFRIFKLSTLGEQESLFFNLMEKLDLDLQFYGEQIFYSPRRNHSSFEKVS